MNAHLELRGLTKQHVDKAGGLQILDNIDLDIEKGAFVSLVGPSGCGKNHFAADYSRPGQRLLGRTAPRGHIFYAAVMPAWDLFFRNLPCFPGDR
jgi:ABC-type glutathione transport system ATPase component